jgi:hypothetical protein
MQVKLGKPEAQGFAQGYPGLIVVRAELDPTPGERWKQLFERNPHFTGWPMSLHAPKIYASEVEVQVPDESIEEAVKALRERVEWANREYEQHVKPEIEARERTATQAKAERENRLSDAQRRIDEIDS